MEVGRAAPTEADVVGKEEEEEVLGLLEEVGLGKDVGHNVVDEDEEEEWAKDRSLYHTTGDRVLS